LRIMTIHAFCQSLLRRFPLEAGVAPHFDLLDERGSAELMAVAREDMLEVAGEREGSDLARALGVVSGRGNEQEFADLLGGLIRARGRILSLIDRVGDLDAVNAATRQRLGLAAGDSEAGFRAAGVTDAAFDLASLRQAAAALALGSEGLDRPAGG